MKKIALGLGALLLGMVALVWLLNTRDEPDLSAPVAAFNATPELLARGAYLAKVGNCAACHTVRGGTPYAGGRGIATPFGAVYSSNLTPDVQTGIGNWSPAEFWRALHNGRSKDGRLLYPAFPYPSYTTVTRADSDALYAYLHSLPATAQPAAQPTTTHALRWPFNQQAALAVWRALYFQPGSFQPEPAQSAAWNRGAYLANGLGHCAACHSPRNALGGSDAHRTWQGGVVDGWVAPALTSPREAGVQDWPLADTVRLLHTGVAPQGTVQGPMAEVVLRSTQFWSADDLAATATYLQALPQILVQGDVPGAPRTVAQAAKLYEQHCAQCHGAQGQGVAGAYPALAGNRAVTLANPANLVQIVRNGGFAPATAGHPRPFGMPPFVLVLNDADIAAVLTHIRTAWGNQAAAVTELEVARQR